MKHEVQDFYESGTATKETIASIFKDEWVSAVPGVKTGGVPLFQDPRVTWAINQAGGVAGKEILELGPLEAGHTYMLAQAGAKRVTAIEANSKCYLKSLLVKEMLELDNTRFLFGNFVPWLQDNTRRFDYIHAAGVLYHMIDPVQLLDLLCNASNQIYLWTHYADLAAMPASDPRYQAGVTGIETARAHGRDYKLFRRHYHGSPSTDPKFCGGVHKNPAWIEKNMILHVLHQHGFKTTIDHDEPQHQNGPCFSVMAGRG
ncbi:class I SAM-dependent methyltransferase (plasmid) [Rhizobium sp. CB3171]|uniref:class I SAM-dependent methyltransferase n=1 Tax=Rhizobium sp. CB3171 TaxID=3039157 RepID=UPI0024B1B522|nr:class I SAM-dependent methyltransferase [Rhizobium sp. CB3171]WFU05948.1 class I SAM-dependent methyltransferase [Rhizobium sp. CB3171]